jgi:dolichol-phosphate mannosyltransferase
MERSRTAFHAGTPEPSAPEPTAPEPTGGREKPGILKALVRFGVVGAIGTVVNLVILQLLYQVLGLGFTRSSAMATEVAILGNYLGNELWVFHHRRVHLGRMLRFNATMIFGAVVQVTVATILKDHIHHLPAQAIGIMVGSGLNFAANFGWTWRR